MTHPTDSTDFRHSWPRGAPELDAFDSALVITIMVVGAGFAILRWLRSKP